MHIYDVLMRRRLTQSLQKIKDSNPIQTDHEFISVCFEHPSKEQKKVALAVRRAIARLGKIDDKFIRAEVSFIDLNLLPFWRWCGDSGSVTSRFIEAIELEINFRFTEYQLVHATVTDPDKDPHKKICDFIREFYEWYDPLNSLKN